MDKKSAGLFRMLRDVPHFLRQSSHTLGNIRTAASFFSILFSIPQVKAAASSPRRCLSKRRKIKLIQQLISFCRPFRAELLPQRVKGRLALPDIIDDEPAVCSQQAVRLLRPAGLRQSLPPYSGRKTARRWSFSSTAVFTSCSLSVLV